MFENYRQEKKKKNLPDSQFTKTGGIAYDLDLMIDGRLYVYDFSYAHKDRYKRTPIVKPVCDNIITHMKINWSPSFIDISIRTDGVAEASGRITLSLAVKETPTKRVGFCLVGSPYRYVCCRKGWRYDINDPEIAKFIPTLKESFKLFPEDGSKPINIASMWAKVEKHK